MVAQLRPHRAAATALHLVPPMAARDDDSPQPVPSIADGRIVLNTIRCQNELCKLPLIAIVRNPATRKKEFSPLHAHLYFGLDHGVVRSLVECPACNSVRSVTLR